MYSCCLCRALQIEQTVRQFTRFLKSSKINKKSESRGVGQHVSETTYCMCCHSSSFYFKGLLFYKGGSDNLRVEGEVKACVVLGQRTGRLVHASPSGVRRVLTLMVLPEEYVCVCVSVNRAEQSTLQCRTGDADTIISILKHPQHIHTHSHTKQPRVCILLMFIALCLCVSLQATDNDIGTFGVVRYYFSDEPDQ